MNTEETKRQAIEESDKALDSISRVQVCLGKLGHRKVTEASRIRTRIVNLKSSIEGGKRGS